jgi:hypothetical protein
VNIQFEPGRSSYFLEAENTLSNLTISVVIVVEKAKTSPVHNFHDAEEEETRMLNLFKTSGTSPTSAWPKNVSLAVTRQDTS